MNKIDRLQYLCKAREITIKKVEDDLGYSNGSLAKGFKEHKISADRLYEVAKYFDVSMEYLMTGEPQTVNDVLSAVAQNEYLLQHVADLMELQEEERREACNYIDYLSRREANRDMMELSLEIAKETNRLSESTSEINEMMKKSGHKLKKRVRPLSSKDTADDEPVIIGDFNGMPIFKPRPIKSENIDAVMLTKKKSPKTSKSTKGSITGETGPATV